MEDIELDILQNLNKGKESALKEIYRLFFHALCAFGTRFVKNDAVVADIVQEVFIKVWARSCLLYTSPSPRDMRRSRMPSSA